MEQVGTSSYGGAYFGVLLVFEKFLLFGWLKKAPAVVGHIYTMFFVIISWVIFAFEDLGKGSSIYWNDVRCRWSVSKWRDDLFTNELRCITRNSLGFFD